MNKAFPIILTGTVALFISGCSGSSGYKPQPIEAVKKGSVEPGKEAVLFPAKVGTQWNYDSDVSLQVGSTKRDQTEAVTFSVIDSKTDGDVTKATISIKTPEKETDRTGWTVSKDGIFQNSARMLKSEFSPPQLVVKFPVKEGDTYTQEMTGPVSFGEPTKQSIRNKVLGWEEVDTSMGRVSALCVESIVKYTSSQKDSKGVMHDIPIEVHNSTWWAPSVGLVRLRQQTLGPNISILQTLRLKSKSPRD